MVKQELEFVQKNCHVAWIMTRVETNVDVCYVKSGLEVKEGWPLPTDVYQRDSEDRYFKLTALMAKLTINS